jgi:hypothetical protein
VVNTDLTASSNLSIDSYIGSLEGDGSLTLTGPGISTWTGGTIAIPLVNESEFDILDGGLHTIAGVAVTNKSEMKWYSGGEIDLLGDATLDNESEFDDEGGGDIIGGPATSYPDAGGTFVNSGTFDVAYSNFPYPSSVSTTIVDVSFEDNAPGSDGSESDGDITVDDSDLVLPSFTNGGEVSVAYGVLSVLGDYTQTSSGILDDEFLQTSEPPPLQVRGKATLAGTIEVGQTYDPIQPGMTFPVLLFGSSSGNFSSVSVPRNAGLPAFKPQLTANGYNLVSSLSTPTGLTLDPADATNGPGATTLSMPRFTGRADPGSMIQVYDSANHLIATATTAANGTFVTTPKAPLSVGLHAVSAVEVNSSGVYGPGGPADSIRILPPGPPAPRNLTILANDDTGGPGVTAVHRPRLTGSATPGDLVQVYDQNNNLVASATANARGVFVATPAQAFVPGTFRLRAVAILMSGGYASYGANSSAFSLTISPPPPAPTGLTLDLEPGNQTADTRPQLAGVATAGDLVQIYMVVGNSDTLVASATAGPDGVFVAVPTSPFSAGVHTLKAVAIDAGGNYGANSSPYTLIIT